MQHHNNPRKQYVQKGKNGPRSGHRKLNSCSPGSSQHASNPDVPNSASQPNPRAAHAASQSPPPASSHDKSDAPKTQFEDRNFESTFSEPDHKISEDDEFKDGPSMHAQSASLERSDPSHRAAKAEPANPMGSGGPGVTITDQLSLEHLDAQQELSLSDDNLVKLRKILHENVSIQAS